MLAKPFATSFPSSLENKEPSHSSLAHRSLELYDFIKDEYLGLDRCWGEDMDIIKDEITRSMHKCQVLDAGCGPGWHAMQCSQFDNVAKVQGLDFSMGMIASAQNRVYRNTPNKQIEFHVHDLLKPLGDFGFFDLAISMNNVLGNVLSCDISTAESDRRQFLDNLRSHLTPSGRAIFSVYMQTYMPQDCVHGEDKGFRILDESEPHNGDLIIEYNPMPALDFSYYSHWFSEEELGNLLSESGFEIFQIIERPPRNIIISGLINSNIP